MARQIIVYARPKTKNTRGIAIDKDSIGIVWLNGRPYRFNPDLMYNTIDVTIDEIEERYFKKKMKKRYIYITRKSSGKPP